MGKHGQTTGGAARAIGIVVTVVLAVVAVVGGGLAASMWRTAEPAEVAAPHPANLLAASAQVAAPLTSQVRTCSVDDLVTAPAALDFHGLVVDSETGEVLFERQAAGTHPTASVMKLVTTASALVTLGPDYRIPTRVYPGDQPGSVVIVGGGDPTLKSQASSYYASATASIADLAQSVQAAGGATAVGYDASVFEGVAWHPTWNDEDRRDGYITPTSGLMVDGGRTDPTNIYSPRTATPDSDAAREFAAAVEAPVDESLRVKPGSEPIAEVWSEPVSALVEYVLVDSDNVVAESLARLVAIERGIGASFADISAGAQASLAELGLAASDFVGADGSGLSRDNRASSALIVGLLEVFEQEPGLEPLIEYLPENQLTGTLDNRLGNVPAGAITAKTGWIDQVYSLAGYMTLEDERQLTFAIFVTVADPNGSTITSVGNRQALDAIAAGIWSCGMRLSTY